MFYSMNEAIAVPHFAASARDRLEAGIARRRNIRLGGPASAHRFDDSNDLRSDRGPDGQDRDALAVGLG